MNLLATVNQNHFAEGIRVVIAGMEKMGKTTLACGAPYPLLVPLEIGYGGVNIPKTEMVTDYASVLGLLDDAIKLVQQGQFPYRSIIFDSATALERRIHESVLAMDGSYTPGNPKGVTMESALGGYGKAYSYANDMFSQFLTRCDWLAVYGSVNIILTCHVFTSKLIDPNAGEYDSWDLLLHSPKNLKTYGKREMITQWADIVGFLYEPMYISKGDNITRGFSHNKGRMLGLSRTPSYVAGNRFGIEGELAIPKQSGWNVLAQALYQQSNINVYTQETTS